SPGADAAGIGQRDVRDTRRGRRRRAWIGARRRKHCRRDTGKFLGIAGANFCRRWCRACEFRKRRTTAIELDRTGSRGTCARRSRVALAARRRKWNRSGVARVASGVADAHIGEIRDATLHAAAAGRGRRLTIGLSRRDIPPAALALAAAGMPAVLARIYASRGITSPTELDHGFSALPS